MRLFFFYYGNCINVASSSCAVDFYMFYCDVDLTNAIRLIAEMCIFLCTFVYSLPFCERFKAISFFYLCNFFREHFYVTVKWFTKSKRTQKRKIVRPFAKPSNSKANIHVHHVCIPNLKIHMEICL